MGDTEGELRIKYPIIQDGKTVGMKILDFGAITSIRASITKATSTIPLVSMGVDRAFQLETGSTLVYYIDFKRKSPIDYDNSSSESTDWSNKQWYDVTTALVNRWQMKTDGCTLTFTPTVLNPYVAPVNVNGYIKVLSRRYTNDYNELISGSIQFVVGTTHVLSGSMELQPTLESEKQNRTILLKIDPSQINLATEKKYGLSRVIYTMKKTGGFVFPDMPPQWSLYANFEGKHIVSWTMSDATHTSVGKPGDPLDAKTMSDFGDVLTLVATWGEDG